MTTPALCLRCAHRRPATGPNLPSVPATSVEQQKAMAEVTGELRARRMLEGQIVSQMSSSAMSFRPIDHDWCRPQSAPDEKRFWFCEWLTGPTCALFAGEPGSAQATTDTAPQPANSTPGSPSPDRDWALPLGRRTEIQPFLRLDGRDLELDYQTSSRNDGWYELSGRGFMQTMLIFGGPGAGKTVFFKRLVEGLFDHPDRPGFLLLDPKGALKAWMVDVCAAKRPGEAPLIVAPRTGTVSPRGFNVLGSFLGSGALGRLIADVILAESPDVDQGWAVLLIDLMEATCTILQYEQGTVTARELFSESLFPQWYDDGKGGRVLVCPIQARARNLTNRATRHEDVPESVLRACRRIHEYFTATEDKHRRFVRQLVEAALGDLAEDDWSHLSDAESTIDPYEMVFRDGAVVMVSVGQASPAFQRSLSTLMKALYQQRVLMSITEGDPSAAARLSVLACDEYAQVVTEGSSGLVSDARFFSLSREAGCLNLFALQSVATARSRFPAQMRDRWEGILGNVGVRFFMGLNDLETAQLASSLAGDRDRAVRMMSSSQSASGTSVADSNSMVKVPVVPPWYLTNRMQTGAVMVQGKLDGLSAPVLGFFQVPFDDQR